MLPQAFPTSVDVEFEQLDVAVSSPDIVAKSAARKAASEFAKWGSKKATSILATYFEKAG